MWWCLHHPEQFHVRLPCLYSYLTICLGFMMVCAASPLFVRYIGKQNPSMEFRPSLKALTWLSCFIMFCCANVLFFRLRARFSISSASFSCRLWCCWRMESSSAADCLSSKGNALRRGEAIMTGAPKRLKNSEVLLYLNGYGKPLRKLRSFSSQSVPHTQWKWTICIQCGRIPYGEGPLNKCGFLYNIMLKYKILMQIAMQ